MQGRLSGTAGSRRQGWVRQHPRTAGGGLLLLTAVLGYWAVSAYVARGHLRSAQTALDQREWSAARTHLENYLNGRPDSAEAHLLAARAERRLEHHEEAERHLETCQRLQGAETQAIKVERALLRVHRGDLAGAEDFLRDCVAKNDPAAVEILDILSLALIRDRRVPEAHQCLEEALRRQPDDAALLVRHAETAESQGRYDAAIASAQKAWELQRDAANMRLLLARNL